LESAPCGCTDDTDFCYESSFQGTRRS
jgi:hypothetical protein